MLTQKESLQKHDERITQGYTVIRNADPNTTYESTRNPSIHLL
jgi:hypothetical protein